jgi:hypothetical protein
LAFAVVFGLTPGATANAASGCPGPLASPGAVVRGPILQVLDGSRFCVALSPSPSTWLQVILPLRAAKRSTLMAAMFGKIATCVIGPNGTGDCLIEGKPLVNELRRVELIQSSLDWR